MKDLYDQGKEEKKTQEGLVSYLDNCLRELVGGLGALHPNFSPLNFPDSNYFADLAANEKRVERS